jgi:hypothetical protein
MRRISSGFTSSFGLVFNVTNVLLLCCPRLMLQMTEAKVKKNPIWHCVKCGGV